VEIQLKVTSFLNLDKMTLKLKVALMFAVISVYHGYVDCNCPTVTPMANFNAQSFLGSWFAIRRFSTIFNGFATSCIAMNATFANRNTFGLELLNIFSQRTPKRILGTLVSNGVFNIKFQVGLGEFRD
jgi:lipocalin